MAYALCGGIVEMADRVVHAPQALFCQVTPRHVLNMCDVSNIWHVPIMMEAQGAHKSICDILQLGGHEKMDLTGTARELTLCCTKRAIYVPPLLGRRISIPFLLIK